MAGTLVGVFKHKDQAERAAQALMEAGVEFGDLTIVNRKAGGEKGSAEDGNVPEESNQESIQHAVREVPVHDVEQPINTADEIAPRAVVGIVIGASLGALLVSLWLFLPGLHPFLQERPLMWQLVWSIGFGLLGGWVATATAGGVPEKAAQRYHTHVDQGDTLLTVLAGRGHIEHYQDIMREHGGSRFGYFSRFIDSIQSIES